VLFDKPAFERVNGYPNVYWGWGPEDLELGQRCEMAGLGFDRRDGTYTALPHEHAGFVAPGVRSEAAQRTHALYKQRRPRLREWMEQDGLCSLKFETIQRGNLAANGVELANVHHYLVDIGQPDPLP